MTTTLRTPTVAEVLRRLHATADIEDPEAKQQVQTRERELGHRLPAAERYQLYGDAPLAITRQVGELYYLLTVTRRPTTIVEFGSSHGISTIYLAAGLRDSNGGTLITTEIVAKKAEWTRQNLRQTGLDELVEVRVGDALTTLKDVPDNLSLVILDGRNDQYTPVLSLLKPRLAPGALIVADLSANDPDLLAYQDHVRRPDSGFFSTEIPLDVGVELSVRLS